MNIHDFSYICRAIPRHGNKAEIVLTVLHRNFIGDEFLGQVTIPLSDFDVYDKPKNKWYSLKCKPGQEKTNYRGDMEVRVSFTVQSGVTAAGSLSELKKDGIRASFGQLSQKVGSSIGGSLLSLKGKGDKKGIKSFAKAVGSKVNKVSTLPGRGHKKKGLDDNFGAIPEQQSGSSTNLAVSKNFTMGGGGGGYHHRNSEADPGVISDDEDEFRFDELSHKSSHSSLSVSQVALGTPRDGSLENLGGGEFLRRNYATPPPVKSSSIRSSDHQITSSHAPPPEKPERWSTGPVDDWETKLFGKQQTILDKASASSLKSLGRNSLGKSSTIGSSISDEISNQESKQKAEEKTKRTNSFQDEDSLKPTFQSIFSTAGSTPANTTTTTTTAGESKEPVPKPRHSSSSSPVVPKSSSKASDNTKVKSQAPQPPSQTTTLSSRNNSFVDVDKKSNNTPPPKPASKDSTAQKNLNNNNNNNNHSTPPTKEPPTMVTPTKPSNDISGGDDISPNNQKWTPVGITNPIRQKPSSQDTSHQETRVPRELIKKFENRSREDLIEMIMKQQNTLEYQKQKLNDMEDYIDNLLVRVMENKPTLLQTPYVTHRPMMK